MLADALCFLLDREATVRRYAQGVCSDPTVVCRSAFGSLAYDILDQYGGYGTEPAEFRRIVANEIFANGSLCNLIRATWSTWLGLLRAVAPHLSVAIVWVVPTDYAGVARNMIDRRRRCHAVEPPDPVQVRNYIENQAAIFRRLHQLTNVGTLVVVERCITRDIIRAVSDRIAAEAEASRLPVEFGRHFGYRYDDSSSSNNTSPEEDDDLPTPPPPPQQQPPSSSSSSSHHFPPASSVPSATVAVAAKVAVPTAAATAVSTSCNANCSACKLSVRMTSHRRLLPAPRRPAAAVDAAKPPQQQPKPQPQHHRAGESSNKTI